MAAFDFDGTLAHGDSLIPFLMRLRGRRAVAAALAGQGPSIAWAVAGRASRDRAKERFIARLLAGVPHERAVAVGQAFAQHLVSHRMRADMVARAAWHRDQGHELVLVSASLAVYLEPLGGLLGFHHVLATALEVGPDGLLTGRLLGSNVRGPEKAARLTTWLGPDAADVELWAYGDSSGDHDMLSLASAAYLVGRRGVTPWTG